MVQAMSILACKCLRYNEGLGTPSGAMVLCVNTEAVLGGHKISAELDTVL